MSDVFIMKSSSAINAPGMVKFFISAYKCGDSAQKLTAIEGMSAWENLPGSIILDVLREKKEYTIDGDTVLIPHSS